MLSPLWLNAISDVPGPMLSTFVTPQNAGLPSRASVPSIMARTPCPGSSLAPS